jgi:DNA-binding XRE family transcriptional regulator
MNMIDRKKINLDKLRNYPTVNEALDKDYGVVGTASREKFTEQAQAFFTGQLIEDARKNAHLTQDELAKRVGSNKSYISRIETGKTEPKVSTFYRIAAALGLSVDLNPIHS